MIEEEKVLIDDYADDEEENDNERVLNSFNNCFNGSMVINANFIYCPICKHFTYFYSEYLDEAFKDDDFTYNAACLVTHYRHDHIRYYDNSWKYWYYRDKNPEYKKLTHDEYRILVNNRAKRQLLRAIYKDSNLKPECKIKLIKAFKNLQHNDDKTNELIDKLLNKLEKEMKS